MMRTMDADVVVVGAGMSGLYALKVLRDQGSRVIVLEKGAGRGRHLVLEPLPGRALRHPEPRVLVRLRPRARAGVGVDRALRVPARDRALPQPHRRSLRPAPRHPARHRRRPRRRSTRRPTPGSSTPRPASEFRARFVVMATGGLSAPQPADVAGHRHRSPGTIVQTSLWPEERRRARGQAHRHRRHRLVGGAGHPRAGQGRRAPHRVPAHRRVHLAVAEPAADRRRAGRDQGPVPRAARASSTSPSAAPRARPAR